MNKSNDFGDQLTDEFLHSQADAGDYFLEEEAFGYRLTQQEMQMLVLQGRALLFIDSFRPK